MEIKVEVAREGWGIEKREERGKEGRKQGEQEKKESYIHTSHQGIITDSMALYNRITSIQTHTDTLSFSHSHAHTHTHRRIHTCKT